VPTVAIAFKVEIVVVNRVLAKACCFCCCANALGRVNAVLWAYPVRNLRQGVPKGFRLLAVHAHYFLPILKMMIAPTGLKV